MNTKINILEQKNKATNNYIVQVGIADLKYIQHSGCLKTLLGSCVGVLLIDPVMQLAGLLHILLPFQCDTEDHNKLKYADTGIPILLSGMRLKGAKQENIYAKIAGGAKMFSTKENSIMAEIGNSNIDAVKKALNKNKIKIKGNHTGGKTGRIIMFSWPEEIARVSIIGSSSSIIL